MITISLPWPPSVNHYYRPAGRGRLIISDEGNAYRKTVAALVMVYRSGYNARREPWPFPLSCRVRAGVIAYPPNKRRRDLDNLMKALLDALTHAGVWDDDSLIDDLHIKRGGLREGGRLAVSIGAA